MFFKLFKSGFGSTISSLFYYFTAYELDKIYSDEVSNIIAYLLSATMNYIFQYSVFLKSTFNIKYIKKYILITIIELVLNQIIVTYLLSIKDKLIKYFPDKLKKYYNTIIRFIVVYIVFFLISYPSRSKFIFV